jgi:glycosyltransferase involved in cell wall biosynthesis
MEKFKNYSSPKISVIIPTYKRPHLIGRAIKSVLNQTYQNFEIIVIDDSPDDETEKVVKSFNNIRIRYKRNKIRRGFVGAKNQGVEESSISSKYVAFLDDDDEWLSEFLEKTAKKIEEKNDIVMVTTSAALKSQNGKMIKKIPCVTIKFWRSCIGNGCLIKKEIFNKENIWYDEKMLFEDLDFGIRVLKNHKGACIPEILRIYYGYPTVIGESHTTSFTPKTPSEEIEYFYKKNYQIYKEAGREAMGWIHFITGKTFCRAGQLKRGRFHLWRALKAYPRPEYLFYYLLALFFPKAFKNLSLIILKHKIFQS